MISFRSSHIVLALIGLASLAGCYERRPVEMKIRPITSPSSSIGAPLKAPPAEKPVEDKTPEQTPEDTPATSAEPKQAESEK